jgi:uncharacterized Zn finger protein
MVRLPSTGARPLPAPDDGLVASARAESRIGELWRASLQALSVTHAEPLAQARSLARGRVRELSFSPGLADAEVVDTEAHRVTLRVRTLDHRERHRIAEVLAGELRWIAALLEGELPEAMLQALAHEGIRLLPDWRRRYEDELGRRLRDIEGDCSCEHAWKLPCGHLAALALVLADVIEGDPLLLLLLRGLDAEHLMAALRGRWGDHTPASTERPWLVEPDDSGFVSPAPLPSLAFRYVSVEGTPGLDALGPAPEGADLAHALAPLYDAGATAAAALLAHAPPRTLHAARVEPAPEVADPTEVIVDLLAENDTMSLEELAEALGLDEDATRDALDEMRELGLVARRGRGAKLRYVLA